MLKKGHSSTLAFKKLSHAVLFNCEIMGQLSDGYWENATPHTHWHWIRDIDVAHVPDMEKGVSIPFGHQPRKRYNFANKELVDCVGDRMLNYVHFAMLFGYDNARFGQDVIDFDDIVSYSKGSGNQEYWKKRIDDLGKALNLPVSRETVAQVRKQMADCPYTLKDLRSDLKEMSDLINPKKF